jgi:cyclophilin family peptidyl-prolyl cis-trans isomerase
MCIDPEISYTAEMVTNYGTLVIALDPISAPKTVNNFVCLARYHFYDGLTFHRVIKGFVLQGGCPEGSGRGGPGYRFEDELPKPGRYELGSMAMANAGPNTNGSQFFVISGPSDVALPPQYSLFGKVVKGIEHVALMEKVETGAGDRPLQPMTIESVSISEQPRV